MGSRTTERARVWTAALLVATSAFVGTGDDVAAGPLPVRIVAEGLNGPFGLQFGGGRLYVAESDAGQVIRVNHRTGRTRVVTDELQSPSGVARVGTGRVYILNARSGDVLDVISGLTAPTGVAVAPDGAVYASELLHGAPEGDGPPPPGFDPSEVGRSVRIAVDGTRTYADVRMPVGLDWHGGKLYSRP